MFSVGNRLKFWNMKLVCSRWKCFSVWLLSWFSLLFSVVMCLVFIFCRLLRIVSRVFLL